MEDFDFSCMNDKEYNEAAVREDLITPILKSLGYGHSGKNKMIRDKRLTHPFVYLGSQKKDIQVFPDSVLEIDN